MDDTLAGRLDNALKYRSALLSQLRVEATNAYRLFHGSAEGHPGLTVDRYGDLLLVQSFHSSLQPSQLAALEAFYAQAFPGLILIYNDRSRTHSRIVNKLSPAMMAVAMQPRQAQELGVNYRIQARHAGQDPWLFLDLRAARRRVMQEIGGKSLLNLFAYTCGVGVAAGKAKASSVWNVDFAQSSLAVGKENAKLNQLPASMRFIQSDAFSAMRQLSGLGQPTVVRGKRMPHFDKLEKRRFDMVFLDPPPYARSPFGVVDLIHDYPALFKPALLCTADGGSMVCCNNVARVAREAWIDQLDRSARKAGRPIREVEWIMPESDFPSPDGRAPLKMALLRL